MSHGPAKKATEPVLTAELPNAGLWRQFKSKKPKNVGLPKNIHLRTHGNQVAPNARAGRQKY
jgi:hypothetical protein